MNGAQTIFIIVEVLSSIVLVIVGYSIGRHNQSSRLSRNANKQYQAILNKGRQELEETITRQNANLQEELHQTAIEMSSYIKATLDQTLQDETKQYKLSLGKVRQTGIDAILQSQAKLEKQNILLKDKYEAALSEVRQFSIDSIRQSQAQIEQQNSMLRGQLVKDLEVEKQHRISEFEEHMADVIVYYVQTAVGSQLEIGAQLPAILTDLQTTKTAMLEDITHGA